MEGCSKTSAGAVSGLPDDPLVEILSRLPAKSVCRFKCVSKAWRDLIAHPDHRKKLRQPMQGFFVQKYEYSNHNLDSNSNLHRTSFSFVNLTVRTVPLDIDPSFSFLKEMTGNMIFLLDSCNGLILFELRQEPSSPLAGYIVCNPTTKHWLAVPPCGSPEALTDTYLAFDLAVSCHFHLVQFQFQMPDVEHMIESLHVYSSEAGTWSQNQIDEQKEQGKLEGWHHQFTPDPYEHQCAFVNGFLHLIVWYSDEEHIILALNVQGTAKRLIVVPGMADGRHEHSWSCYLGQSQGHLHCVTAQENSYKLSIWVLQDYDSQEWVLKNTVDCQDVFGEASCTQISDLVFDIHQDCNVFFIFQMSLGYKLVAYDMDRKEVSVTATFDDYKLRSDFARYIPCFSESPALTDKH